MSLYDMYDEEAVYQDADILQAQYEAESRRFAALQRRGICTHNSWVGRSASGEVFYPEQADLAEGEVRCTSLCKQKFASEAELRADGRRAYDEG